MNFAHYKNRFYFGLKGKMPVSKTIPYKEFVPEAKEIQEIVDITDDDESVVVHEERNMVNITIDSLHDCIN